LDDANDRQQARQQLKEISDSLSQAKMKSPTLSSKNLYAATADVSEEHKFLKGLSELFAERIFHFLR
jgi:hypothetical protein